MIRILGKNLTIDLKVNNHILHVISFGFLARNGQLTYYISVYLRQTSLEMALRKDRNHAVVVDDVVLYRIRRKNLLTFTRQTGIRLIE